MKQTDPLFTEFTYDKMIIEVKNKLKSLNRQRRKDYGEKRPKYELNLPKQYRSYIMSANKRQIEFSLSVEEFETITANNCVYCGVDSRIGVDRISSKEGYTIENSQPCCTTCNLMKYTYTNEFFINHIKKIYNFVTYQK